MQGTVREGLEAGRACEVENGYWKLSREHRSPCGVHTWPWPSSVPGFLPGDSDRRLAIGRMLLTSQVPGSSRLVRSSSLHPDKKDVLDFRARQSRVGKCCLRKELS